jgi:hypothetical protein
VRDGIDAAQQLPLVHLGVRDFCDPKRDLGLQPRLRQTVERAGDLALVRFNMRHCRMVHRPPDRRVHPVFVPDGAVGEADLPADGPFAAGKAAGDDQGGDSVGVLQIEGR